MNTNSNVYTIIYTTVIVVVVAAVLAFAAMKLKPMQTANEKASTISQIMLAAEVRSNEEIAALSNEEKLALYSESIAEAFTISLKGEKIADLNTSKDNIELIDNLKAQDYAIKNASDATLPVYVFKNGVSVIPVYGAGLWGPIWGYIALEQDHQTISGAYFDHASETPGLGAKIKDEKWFQDQFKGKVLDLEGNPIDIVKGGAAADDINGVDAISGATMTCNGLHKSIDTWVMAYSAFLKQNQMTEEVISNE